MRSLTVNELRSCAHRDRKVDRTWRDTTDFFSCVPRKGFAETAKAAMFAICNWLNLHTVLTGSDLLSWMPAVGRYQTSVVLAIYTPDKLAAHVNVARAGARWPQASSGNLIGCIFGHEGIGMLNKDHVQGNDNYELCCMACDQIHAWFRRFAALMHSSNGVMHDLQTRACDLGRACCKSSEPCMDLTHTA